MPARAVAGTDPPVSRWVRGLDALTLSGVLAAVVVECTGGLSAHPFGVRLSVHSPHRVLFWAVVIAAIRHYVCSSPTALERLAQRGWIHRDPPPETSPAFQRPLAILALVGFFGAVVAVALRVQLLDPYGVPDYGDPLFSVWRLAWVVRALFNDPTHMFDANIFHPEPDTLAYSDAMIVPSLFAAPLFWIHVPRMVVYTIVLASALVASGVTTCLFVARLTSSRAAGLVAGTVFTLYPYRFEHYSHLELQMTMWMPVALLLLHKLVRGGGPRTGAMLGVVLGLQTLSSLYYGIFLSTYLAFVFAGLMFFTAAGRPRGPVRGLVVAALVAGLFAAPLAAPYLRNRTRLGERDEWGNRFYSATAGDYLSAHPRSTMYGGRLPDGRPERCLFPGVTPVILSAIALVPPLNTVRAAYGAALLLSFDASLGFNGTTYPAYFEALPPFRGLRVPARFSVLVGLSLAVLSGLGLARLRRRLSRRGTLLLSAALIAAVFLEYRPSLALQPVWREMPAVYGPLVGKGAAVVAVFPMSAELGDNDAKYEYFSTWHWQRLLNGYSGNFPPSYEDLLQRMRRFPAPDSVAYLKRRGVQFLVLHGEFGRPTDYDSSIAALDVNPDLELVGVFPGEPRPSKLYQLKQDSR